MASPTLPKETISFVDYLIDVDEFTKPKEIYNHDAMATMLMHLALLDPGTYQTRPDMGLGLNTKWLWHTDKEVFDCAREFRRQIRIYLPWFAEVNVSMKMIDRSLSILITLDNEVYHIMFDLSTKTLSSL